MLRRNTWCPTVRQKPRRRTASPTGRVSARGWRLWCTSISSALSLPPHPRCRPLTDCLVFSLSLQIQPLQYLITLHPFHHVFIYIIGLQLILGRTCGWTLVLESRRGAPLGPFTPTTQGSTAALAAVWLSKNEKSRHDSSASCHGYGLAVAGRTQPPSTHPGGGAAALGEDRRRGKQTTSIVFTPKVTNKQRNNLMYKVNHPSSIH